MNEVNPYAAPNVAETYVGPAINTDWNGLWRDNKDLVMHREARLPAICVKTGVPVTNGKVRRKLSWHTPWIALAILVNVLIYIILAVALTKRATIDIPLAPERIAQRKSRLLACWIAGFGSIIALLVCIGVIVEARNPSAVWMLGIFASIITLVVALVFGQVTARILRTTKITKTHIWLRGVHENILEQLPPLPQVQT